jgi:hypothetical protein
MKNIILVVFSISFLIIINQSLGQPNTQNFKSFLNTGIGIYVPLKEHTAKNDIGYAGTINLETEITTKTIVRFSIDSYRIPLAKKAMFNNTLIEDATKANATSVGIDYGLNLKARHNGHLYVLIGTSLCLIDEPEFQALSPKSISLSSQNSNRTSIRLIGGFKRQLNESFTVFVEVQCVSILHKNLAQENLSNGIVGVIGIATNL